MAVRVVTDSASDLPQEVCDELGIEVVPLTIRFGEEEFVDRKELTTDQFWAKLQQSEVLPETAAPSVGAFEETYRRLVDDGADGIVCVNLSGHLSATMQSAQLAAKALDGVCPIEVVDSQNASMGIGNLALHAARRGREGADVATIVAEVEDQRARQTLLATLDTLEYLRKGGRIGGAQAMLGSMLSIKPVITVTDGAVEQAGKVRTRSKALRFIADKVPAGNVETISILHGGAPDVDEFIELITPAVEGADVIVGQVGAVIGVHTGPRVMGVAWIEKRGDVDTVGPSDSEATDRMLAVAAAGGDQRALDTLLTRHADRVHAICRRVLQHPEDALDATQEALISIARGIGSFDGRAQFTTWLYRIATNAALDEVRRRKRRPVALETLPDPGGSGPAIADEVSTRLDVEAALAEIPPDYRAAVALRDLAGLDYAQIAEILGVPPGTVRSRIARGRAALADRLGNRTTGSTRPTNDSL